MATRWKSRGRRGILRDVLIIDGSLARNIDFEVASLEVPKKTHRKTSILKLQSVKIRGSLARNAGFSACTCLVSSLMIFLWPRRVYGGSCKNSPFRKFPSRLSCRFACCVLLDKTCPGRWGSLSGERVPDGLTVQSSFSQFQLANIEGSLARKLRFHIFNFQILKDVSHESIVFPSSTFTFGKCLARKLRFHIFHFRFWREVSHESFVFAASTFRFSHLPPSLLEEGLARKLRFHIFHFQILQEVSHEMRF